MVIAYAIMNTCDFQSSVNQWIKDSKILFTSNSRPYFFVYEKTLRPLCKISLFFEFYRRLTFRMGARFRIAIDLLKNYKKENLNKNKNNFSC